MDPGHSSEVYSGDSEDDEKTSSFHFDVPFLQSSKRDCYGVVYTKLTPDGDAVPCNESTQNLSAAFCTLSCSSSLLVVGDEQGGVVLQDTSLSGSSSILCDFIGDSYAVNDLSWLINNGVAQVVVGGASGTVSLWTIDVEAGAVTKSLELTENICYKCSVTSLATSQHVPGLIITGTDIGNINVWNLMKDKLSPVKVIPRAHYTPGVHKVFWSSTEDHSITGLFLKDKSILFSAGKGNKIVHMWDIHKPRSPVKNFHVKATVSSITMSHSDTLFYVSCLDNSIYCFNCQSEFKSSNPIYRFIGHKVGSLYIKISLSPCGQYLSSGSSDKHLYIWSTNLTVATCKKSRSVNLPIPQVLPIAKLLGHDAEVTAVQWAPAFQQLMLVSLADDSSHRLWRVSLEENECDETEQDETQGKSKWFTNSAIKIVDKKFGSRLQKFCCNSKKMKPTVIITQTEFLPAKIVSPRFTISRRVRRVSHLLSRFTLHRQLNSKAK